MAKENTTSETLDSLLESINQTLTNPDNGSTMPKSYRELEASINVKDTQFAKLEREFPISKSVLKHNLPALFKIIDTISINNIIYSQADLVNSLLNDVLFSELIKIDKKVESFYTNIQVEETSSTCKEKESEEAKEAKKSEESEESTTLKESGYKPLSIVYEESNKYIVRYPDFLDEAFDTIINKKALYESMVTITKKNGKAEDEEEEMVEVTAAARGEETAAVAREVVAKAAAKAAVTEEEMVEVTAAARGEEEEEEEESTAEENDGEEDEEEGSTKDIKISEATAATAATAATIVAATVASNSS